jgi:AraC family transcriptional regulator
MYCSEAQTISVTETISYCQSDLTDGVNIIGNEDEWRRRPLPTSKEVPETKVIATRWRAFNESVLEVASDTTDDCHVVAIALRNMNVRFSVAGRTVLDGGILPGMLHVARPGAPVRCLFRGAYDVLHLHVPTDLITECARDLPGDDSTGYSPGEALIFDPTMERLARAMLEADQVGDTFGQIYADCISISIVMRLLGAARRINGQERPKPAGLVKWRLKRAIDYVEEHLDEPVSLADIATASGLTSMHFAAQFRVATGSRPHEYVMRRRIERAQQLLIAQSVSLVDVALSVGFQNQSHFSTVFKRFVGLPPGAWRAQL